MTPEHYRPDIDGLRTVAVMSVLLYHLGVSGFSGGYVGVDVFFVISGFLITRLIVGEVEERGRLDLWRFYVRRARRLLPALFFTVLMVFLGSALLLSQPLVEAMAESAIAALFSVSNFYFWRQADYFDIEAIAKPLLHTWSLGVEEQYYAVWPLLLVLLLGLRRRIVIFAALFVIAATSFAMNLAFVDGEVGPVTQLSARLARWIQDGRATIFYLPFFRLFEFVIGAAMVWILPALPRTRLLREAASFAGLAMIAVAVFTYTADTVFPSSAALLPCLGAAALIYGGDAPTTGVLLRNPAAVWCGRISYSLYLVHWPLIVFHAQYTFSQPDALEMAALAVVSIVAAVLMYAYVEQPLRYPRPKAARRVNDRFLWMCGGFAVVMILVSLSAMASEGWPWRIPQERRAMTPSEHYALENALCGDMDDEPLFTCAADRGSGKTIHVWGDSHARHLIGGLIDAFPEHNVRILYKSSCLPQSGLFGYRYDYQGREALARQCAERNRLAFDYFQTAEPTVILFHNYVEVGNAVDEVLMASTASLLAALREKGHYVRILSDVIRPDRMLVDCYAVPAIYSDRLLERRCRGDAELAAALRNENEALGRLLGPETFLNLDHVFCESICLAFRDGRPLFRDAHHLTVFGSERLIEAARPLLDIR